MAEAEIFVGLLLTVLYRPLQLEVASRGFLDTPEEVKSVAATGCVELGLQILEFLQDDLLLFSLQVVESDPEASRPLCKEIRVVLNCLNKALLWQESFRQVLDHLRVKPKVVQVEACSQHVRLERTNVVLSVETEDILVRRQNKVTALRRTCPIQDAFGLPFAPKLVKVRIVGKDAHFTLLSENIHQVMHVICLENLVFLCNFFGSHG